MSAMSAMSTTDPPESESVLFVDTDSLGQQQQRQQQRQQQSRRLDIRHSAAASRAAPATQRQPSLRLERPFMEQRLRDFVREVRHQPTLLPPRPRGFHNPRNLCYRNAVVVALLHSRRFVAFLHLHARHGGNGAGGAASALLTRFHALAAAYWEEGGGVGDGKDYRCETLHALLWRTCNYSHVDVPVPSVAAGADEDADGGPSERRSCPSWPAVCREQQMQQLREQGTPVVGGSSSSSSNGPDDTAPVRFWEQQQDAVAFWDWLVEMARAQLLAGPGARGWAGRDGRRARVAAGWFGTMFDVRLATRWVDGWWCQRAVRRQEGTTVTMAATTTTTTRQVGLKVCVSPEEAGGKPETLDDLLAAFFLEDVPARGCGRSDVDACPRCCHGDDDDDDGCCCCCDGTPPCPRGKPQTPRWRLRRRLLAAPEVLPVHLMRVGYDGQGRAVVKHRTAVDVPELLDVSRWLAPHVFAAGSRVVYRLSTVVSHRGRDAQSGHYVAHVRCGGDGGGDGDGDGCSDGGDDGSDGSNDGDGDTGGRWARVDDQKVTLDVPFWQITNVQQQGGVDAATDDNKVDRFDPVLLVYEKWIERYDGSGPTAAAAGRRRWRDDEASAHADGPAAKKPRS